MMRGMGWILLERLGQLICIFGAAFYHLQPWSRGGLHTLENLVVACRSCNSSKNAKTPSEWATYQGGN